MFCGNMKIIYQNQNISYKNGKLLNMIAVFHIISIISNVIYIELVYTVKQYTI